MLMLSCAGILSTEIRDLSRFLASLFKNGKREAFRRPSPRAGRLLFLCLLGVGAEKQRIIAGEI